MPSAATKAKQAAAKAEKDAEKAALEARLDAAVGADGSRAVSCRCCGATSAASAAACSIIDVSGRIATAEAAAAVDDRVQSGRPEPCVHAARFDTLWHAHSECAVQDSRCYTRRRGWRGAREAPGGGGVTQISWASTCAVLACRACGGRREQQAGGQIGSFDDGYSSDEEQVQVEREVRHTYVQYTKWRCSD